MITIHTINRAYEDAEFNEMFHIMAKRANTHAHAAGFYDEPHEFGTRIALMHSELSEALEGFRHGNPASEHIPEFSAIEEELADTVIRIMDTSVENGYKIASAIIAKMDYNKTRPYKHGGKVC